jgi:hypothetical protein
MGGVTRDLIALDVPKCSIHSENHINFQNSEVEEVIDLQVERV